MYIYTGCSRLVDITAGGDFLGLCDKKNSYKHVPDYLNNLYPKSTTPRIFCLGTNIDIYRVFHDLWTFMQEVIS